MTSMVGWVVCEEEGSGGAVYPLEGTLGRGVFCGVGGRALIFGMSLVVGVGGEEIVWEADLFCVVSALDWETLLVPFVLDDSEAFTGKIGCLSWEGW